MTNCRIPKVTEIAGLKGAAMGLLRGAVGVVMFLTVASIQKSYGLSDHDHISPEPNPANHLQANESYGKLSLGFEPNQGQADTRVKYLSRGKGYGLFLTANEAILLLSKTPVQKEAANSRNNLEALLASPNPEVNTRTLLRMELLNANSAPQVAGLDLLSGKSNYFIGNDPDQWHTKIPNYAKVEYRDIYPDVNLIYYGNQQKLEYDFIVGPGADPGIITLGFRGTDKIEIDTRGDLLVHAAGDEIRFTKPFIYQEINGTRREVSGSYLLKGEYQVGFQVAAYDLKKPLVIDPVLVYSTYLGGNFTDVGRGIAVDSEGSAYVTGITYSLDFPTEDPYQATNVEGRSNAFVAKLNPEGSAFVYSTYLGGSLLDSGNGIAIDAEGAVYVTGGTGSIDFPTVNPIQSEIALDEADSCALVDPALHCWDIFLTKLDPTGSVLIYSTYLGGTDVDFTNDIVLDAQGSAYLTGRTSSTDFPTENPFQATHSGSHSDAFVMKVNPGGSAIVYSTYLNSLGAGVGNGIEVDSEGAAYVVGFAGTDFPTVNPIQPALSGGGFVTKLDPTGSSLIYSTYLGGKLASNWTSDIALDAQGAAYVTGVTWASDHPITEGAFQTVFGGGLDAYVTKLNPEGSALVYSTFLGGFGTEHGQSIAVDISGNAYVAGWTSGSDFPAQDIFQSLSGLADAYVAKLNPEGSSLIYFAYLGGEYNDIAWRIALDTAGSVYVTGETKSSDFLTNNPLQPSIGCLFIPGFCVDAFVAKLSETTSVSVDLSITKTDDPDPVMVMANLTYELVVTNNGPDEATEVMLTDHLPESVTYVSATPSQGDCLESEGTVTCDLGNLTSGASATITIVITATMVGEIINVAEVSGNESDPATTNNKATAVTVVNNEGSCIGTGPYTLQGTAAGRNGFPLPGALMTIEGPGGCNDTTLTIANGVYRFKDLANGTYTVTPSKGACSFIPSSRTVMIDGGNITHVQFMGFCDEDTIDVFDFFR
jgi:uncharacterized repeat protein (TIGR01451 family)